MALRRIVIPYSDFQTNTKILAQSFNTNFDEVEYCFNELYEDYVARKLDTYSRTEVDTKVLNDINNAKTLIATNLQNAKDELNTIISNNYLDVGVSLDALYNSVGSIAELEITNIVNEVTL